MDDKTILVSDGQEEKTCVERQEGPATNSSSDEKRKRATGPRTAQGKPRSSKNAIKHGFFSREMVRVHIHKEDRQEYMAVLEELF